MPGWARKKLLATYLKKLELKTLSGSVPGLSCVIPAQEFHRPDQGSSNELDNPRTRCLT